MTPWFLFHTITGSGGWVVQNFWFKSGNLRIQGMTLSLLEKTKIVSSCFAFIVVRWILFVISLLTPMLLTSARLFEMKYVWGELCRSDNNSYAILWPIVNSILAQYCETRESRILWNIICNGWLRISHSKIHAVCPLPDEGIRTIYYFRILATVYGLDTGFRVLGYWRTINSTLDR